jgi:hypothetical protein
MDQSTNETSSLVNRHQMQEKSPITSIPADAEGELSYWIELRKLDDPDAVESVLARALNAELAHAIFRAAQSEHPERRITLRKGDRIVADTLAA